MNFSCDAPFIFLFHYSKIASLPITIGVTQTPSLSRWKGRTLHLSFRYSALIKLPTHYNNSIRWFCVHAKSPLRGDLEGPCYYFGLYFASSKIFLASVFKTSVTRIEEFLSANFFTICQPTH